MKKNNRYFVLAAGMVIQFCAGIIYMWGIFKGPVAKHLSWDEGAAALTSSIMLATFVLGIIVGGKVQDKFGPKKVTLVGSVLISIGMLLTALIPVSTPWLIYLTYGILGGFGVGTVYNATVSTIQKWFPDKRGFASGMIVSAFGFSLVVFAPLANLMLDRIGVPWTFAAFGIGFLLICVTCSFFITTPENGWLPQGFTPSQQASNQKQYTTKEMLKTKQFYLLVGAMLFTLPTYFILNPQLKTLGIDRGLSDETAVLGIMITGIGSACGRLLISWASDKIGRKPALLFIAALTLAATLMLIVAEGVLFLAGITLIAFAFGGSSSVYAAFTAESFGTKHMGLNFGCVMLGFMVSALLFPILSNSLVSDGDYTMSFVLSAATCVIALVLVALLKNPQKE